MNQKQLLDKVSHFKDRNIYRELGVAPAADLPTIKSAYRKKALACHPDKNKSDARAVEKFHELQYILEILENGEARRAYDKHFDEKSNRSENTSRINGKPYDDLKKHAASSNSQMPPRSKDKQKPDEKQKSGSKTEASKPKLSLVESITIEALKVWAKERASYLAKESIAEENLFTDDIQNFLVKVSTKFASNVPPGRLHAGMHGDHYMAGHKVADQFITNKYRHKMRIEAEKSVASKAEKDFFKYGDSHYKQKIELEVNKSLKSIMKNMPNKEVSKSVVMHLQKTAKVNLDCLHKEKWGKGVSWAYADYKLKLQNVAKIIAKEVLVKAENQILKDITHSFEKTEISSGSRKNSSEGEKPKEDAYEATKEEKREPRKETREESHLYRTPLEQRTQNKDYKRDSTKQKSPVGGKEKTNKPPSNTKDNNYTPSEKGESQRSWSSKEEERRKNRQAWRMM